MLERIGRGLSEGSEGVPEGQRAGRRGRGLGGTDRLFFGVMAFNKKRPQVKRLRIWHYFWSKLVHILNTFTREIG